MTLYLLPESMGRAAGEEVEDHVIPGLLRVRLADGTSQGPEGFAVAVVHPRPEYHKTSAWWLRDGDAADAGRWVDHEGWRRTWPWVVGWSLEHYEGQLPVRLVVAPQ